MSAEGLWLVSSVGSNGEGKSGQAGDDGLDSVYFSEIEAPVGLCGGRGVLSVGDGVCVCVSPPAEDSDKGWGIFVKK